MRCQGWGPGRASRGWGQGLRLRTGQVAQQLPPLAESGSPSTSASSWLALDFMAPSTGPRITKSTSRYPPLLFSCRSRPPLRSLPPSQGSAPVYSHKVRLMFWRPRDPGRSLPLPQPPWSQAGPSICGAWGCGSALGCDSVGSCRWAPGQDHPDEQYLASALRSSTLTATQFWARTTQASAVMALPAPSGSCLRSRWRFCPTSTTQHVPRSRCA